MPLDAQPAVRLGSRITATSRQERNDAPCHSIPRWACCYTHPQAERWAEQGLRRQGYTTFLPLTVAFRRDPVIRSMRHRVEVPAFPRYLFVAFDASQASWSPIRDTPGVRDLVKCGSQIQYASSDALEAVRMALGAWTHTDAAWTPGAPCSLALGPLRGHPAVVLATHRDTATLAVLLFGALRQVQAPVAWLSERS
jgi:transcriptional antiterminator RfaH